MSRQTFFEPALCGEFCMTLVHSLWQVALLAAVAWCVGRFLRRSPGAGYAVYVAALVAGLAAMPITFAIVDENGPSGPTADAAVSDAPLIIDASRVHGDSASHSSIPVAELNAEGIETSPGPDERLSDVSKPSIGTETMPICAPSPSTEEGPSLLRSRVAPCVAALYVLGVAVMLVRLVRGMWRTQRLAAGAEVVGDGPLARRLRTLAEAWAMRVVPLLAKSEAIAVPTVVGLFRPMILLPVSALSGLSTEEMEMILAHELAHVRRFDMWVNLLQRVAEVVLFFNPALWYLSRRISTLREYCCDELTCGAISGADLELRTRYASALLRVVEVGRTRRKQIENADVAALAAAGRSPSELRRRVSRLFGEPLAEPVRLSRGGVIAILALAAAMIAGPAAWTTVAAPEESAEDRPAAAVSLDEFPEAVAVAVRRVLEDAGLPFVSNEGLSAIEKEFAGFVKRHMPDDLSEERRAAIIESLRHSGKTHLAIAGKVRRDSVRSVNQAYLGLPDALKTLRWKLWMAMRRGPLSDKEQAALDVQREWMREVISDLPEEQPLERADALGRLQERFDDPLCTPLDRPMDKAQFAKFQAAIQKYLREASTGVEESTPTSSRSIRPHNPLPSINHHFVREALDSQWQGEKAKPLFPRFDDDPICGWGCGLNMRLDFESNRAHRGNNPALDDFDKGGTAMDATTGYPLSIPLHVRKTDALFKWLTEQGRGDFIYKNGALTAVRGARLLPLDVTTWYEADAISDADLRTRIEKEGEDAVSLNSAFEEYKGEHSVYPPAEYIGPYVGVLTNEGRLAVVHVYDFSTFESIGVHTRVREAAADGRKDAKSQSAVGGEDGNDSRPTPGILGFVGEVKSCVPIGAAGDTGAGKTLVVSNDPRYRIVVAQMSAAKDDLPPQQVELALAIHSPSLLFHGDAKAAIGKEFRFLLHGTVDGGRREFFHIEAEEIGATPEPSGGEEAGRDFRSVLEEHAADDLEQMMIRVTSRTSGEPLAGVEMECRGYLGNEKSFRKTLKTDRRGVIDLRRPRSAKMESFWVKIDKTGFVPIFYSWSGDHKRLDLPERLELAMSDGQPISGRVEDEEGRPIAGAEVELIMPVTWPPYRSGAVFPAAELKTDAQGRWSWSGAPQDVNGVSIGITHPDFVSHSDDLRGGSDNVVVLKQGVKVKGRVVDSEGNPVAGATARCVSSRFGGGGPEAVTDEEGRFVLDRCERGLSAVTVQAPGLSPDFTRILADELTGPINFALAPGHTLRGKVIDVNGKPISGVCIIPEEWRGFQIYRMENRRTTDNEGRFVWNGAPGDEVRFSILKEGYLSRRDFAMTAGPEERVVTLLPTLRIAGRVTDAKTGRPVKEFTVRYGSPYPGSDLIYWRVYPPPAYTDGGYRYEFDHPMPGYVLQAVAPGYLPKTSRVFKSEEGKVEFNFELQPGEALSGVVVMPGGKPAAAAEVALATENNRAVLMHGRIDRPRNAAEVVMTDQEGRFILPPCEKGPFVILVVHDAGFATVDGDSLADAKPIVLEPWGKLRGRVLLGDKPDAGRAVGFSSNRPDDSGRRSRFWGADYHATTDTDGRFEFYRVIPGQGTAYRTVSTEFGPGHRQTMPAWYTPVEIKPEETAEVVVGGSGRPVIGKIALEKQPDAEVNWATNEPVSLVPWNVEQGTPRSPANEYLGNLDTSGAFRIPDVPAGGYKLTVPVNDQRKSDASGPGAEIGKAELVFTVPEMPGGRSDEPLDLGTITAKASGVEDSNAAPSGAKKTPDASQMSLRREAAGTRSHRAA